MKIYFVKCFPIICNEVLIGVGNMVINVVLGRQSEQAIAAIAVFRTLEGMVISFFAGFSNAASVLVGTCVGSGELDAAYERAKRLVFLCGSTILCVCLVLLGIRDESFRRINGDRFAHADDLLRGGGYSHVQLGAERYV